jgi:hypothetical protein
LLVRHGKVNVATKTRGEWDAPPMEIPGTRKETLEQIQEPGSEHSNAAPASHRDRIGRVFLRCLATADAAP